MPVKCGHNKLPPASVLWRKKWSGWIHPSLVFPNLFGLLDPSALVQDTVGQTEGFGYRITVKVMKCLASHVFVPTVVC